MPKIKEVHFFEWQFSKPDHFPCHICDEREAEVQVTLYYKGLPLKPCLCSQCASMGGDAIFKALLP